MKIQTRRLACQALLLLLAAGSASAKTITCVPVASKDTPYLHWVRRISIDEPSRTVNMDIVRFRTKDSETMGKLKAELVSSTDAQFGEPIYVFNTIPAAGVEVTHLFKLFKSLDDWRLIGAGVTFVGNTPALKAIEPSAIFDCKRSEMG
ncbi:MULTISPECIES: hypothetical protein [unclassified Variovorax]|uniref:hypothetical protein n=1 Tax=unclassified Variovorax TaxID=663243 RepID=UPI000D13C837|nr:MULTISPECIES: hypothetical protein [unclassified Variovorax]AVQ80901.1 hypothetical protein C4F17_08035 [Variovorax sp. PMC12]QRY29709.1 hypothetical protein JVX96_16465 [Variovorax sp. PDNC026]